MSFLTKLEKNNERLEVPIHCCLVIIDLFCERNIVTLIGFEIIEKLSRHHNFVSINGYNSYVQTLLQLHIVFPFRNI